MLLSNLNLITHGWYETCWFQQSKSDGRDLDVKMIMDTWVLQMNYPVVMVKRTGENQLTVTQERFVIDTDSSKKFNSTFGWVFVFHQFLYFFFILNSNFFLWNHFYFFGFWFAWLFNLFIIIEWRYVYLIVSLIYE